MHIFVGYVETDKHFAIMIFQPLHDIFAYNFYASVFLLFKMRRLDMLPQNVNNG